MTAEDAVTRMLRGHGADAMSTPGATATLGENDQKFPLKKPEEGSEEEMAMMQALWADPEFRQTFYAQYGDKLEAMGFPQDGTFPGTAAVQGLSGASFGGAGGGGARGMQIIPEPGFVVKTKTLETNEKVFVNICRSTKVKGFKHEANPADPSEVRVRIPLSLGPERKDLDKGGEPCIVYDVVFNTEVMEQAAQQKEFKEFLVGLALGWIMEKGGGGLDVQNWTLSKLRGNYKGKAPVMQTVRAEALVEEVEPEEPITDPARLRHDGSLPPSAKSMARRAADNANYADSGTIMSASGGGAKYSKYMRPGEDINIGVETPQMRMLVDLGGGVTKAYREGVSNYGCEVQALIVKLEMPRMGAAVEADVDICDKVLAVEVPNKYDIEVALPFEVDDGASDASFDRRKGVLTLTMPLKMWTQKAYASARAKREGKEGSSRFEQLPDDDDDDSGEVQGLVRLPVPSQAEREAAWAAAAVKSGGGDSGHAAGAAATGGRECDSAVAAGTGDNKIDARGGKKERREFEATLQANLQKQSEKTKQGEGQKVILGSKEEKDAKERAGLAAKEGHVVSDRRPFECERCQWRSVATAIRKCKRCHWVEAGSKEEAQMVAEVTEQQKWRASRKQDEVGTVDETGGIQDEESLRAFKFRSRLALELDVDEPSWLQGIREKHYGPGDKEKIRTELANQ